jgi:hypothetical protein
MTTSCRYIATLNEWMFANVHGQLSIWTPAPAELAQQALCFLLNSWVESPMQTSDIFMIPCILQRDWAFISKHVCEVTVLYPPHKLPVSLCYGSLIPLILLYILMYVRSLPILDRFDSPSTNDIYKHWHQQQAEHVRGLS